METQFATGIAGGERGREAGERAATEAFASLGTDRVDFCQVFSSARYDYRGVIDGIRDVIGEDAKLVGCSSAGEFTETTAREGSVTLALVTSDTLSVQTGLGTGLTASVIGCVREATRDIDTHDGHDHHAAINLHDGLAGVGEQLALVTQQKVGSDVSLVGGSAGDDMQMEATHVFGDGAVVRDGVSLAYIGSEQPTVVTVNHGHEPISEPLAVTESEGNIVREIDGRPAFDVWKEHVEPYAREVFGVEVDDLETNTPELTKVLTRYEFGIDQGNDYKIRWPGPTQTTNGPLRFAVDIPEGTVLRVMHSPKDRQIAAVRRAASEAVAKAEAVGTDVAGAFVYDCSCRATILEEEFPTAVGAIADELGVPLLGFETYGEICIEKGQMSGYHNTTAVILLVPK